MPYKASTPCRHRGCSNVVSDGTGYCQQHIKEKRIDNRPTSRQRGYTANWDRFRRIYLREHPICIACSQASLLPHHIIPIADGGDMYDEQNLEPRCFDCHERVHGRKK